jgi:hypothetical protein
LFEMGGKSPAAFRIVKLSGVQRLRHITLSTS